MVMNNQFLRVMEEALAANPPFFLHNIGKEQGIWDSSKEQKWEQQQWPHQQKLIQVKVKSYFFTIIQNIGH